MLHSSATDFYIGLHRFWSSLIYKDIFGKFRSVSICAPIKVPYSRYYPSWLVAAPLRHQARKQFLCVFSCGNSRTPLHLDGGLPQIFPIFMPVNLAKYGVTIICRYSEDMNFHKIWRVLLKNWARYAHFNFEIQEGVADSIFQPHPPNFGQW